jgi:hypothetical protein
MSKFAIDPQVQSLRAMRAGDIAIALPTPVVLAVGVAPVAFAQPRLALAYGVTSVESIVAVTATPAESAAVSAPFVTNLSTDTYKPISIACPNTLEALTAMPSQSPVVGIGFTALPV